MGCSSSKQAHTIVGDKASVDGTAKTLLQRASGSKPQVAVADARRFDQLAAAATAAEKKVAKVADSKIYSTAVESAIAVEEAPTSRRREAWAFCDAAWARALEKGNKAEKTWAPLPQLEVVKEHDADACPKTEQRLGAENAGVVCQGELELDGNPEYPANGTAPFSSDQRMFTVMPGVGGIACDVDEDDSDQAAAECAVDASMEVKLPQKTRRGVDAMRKDGDTETAEDVQMTTMFPDFGFSLFAMCVPHADKGVEELSFAHPETSVFMAR